MNKKLVHFFFIISISLPLTPLFTSILYVSINGLGTRTLMFIIHFDLALL